MKSSIRKINTIDATNRSIVEPATKEAIQKALDEKYGVGTVSVLKVIINNMDFEEAYNAAIESRQIAIMTQQQQKIDNETNIAKATADAESARRKAQGEADATLIAAKAKADANKIIAESINEKTQKQDTINKWNGVLPKYITGDADNFGIIDSEN